MHQLFHTLDRRHDAEPGTDCLRRIRDQRVRYPSAKSFDISLSVKLARILWLTVRDFLRNDCPLHASRLTYLTVLSIVPVIALVLFFMKTVMVEDELRFRTKKAVHEILTSDLGLSFLATEENQFPELDAGSFEEAQLILRLEEERERILYKNFVQVGQDVKEMINAVVNRRGAR